MKSRPILSLLGLYLNVVCAWGNPTYNVNVAPGYTLFANQLALSPNDLVNTPLGALPDKSAIIWWNGTTFDIASKAAGIWSSDPTINVGQGFYCSLPSTASPVTIPFSGISSSTPTAIASFDPTTEWYLVGSQTYDSTLGATYNFYDITGYNTPPAAGVSLYRARNAQPGGTPVNSIPPNSPSDWNEYWYDGAWHPFDPAIYLGEAVWIGPSRCSIEGTVTDGNGAPLSNWEISLSDGQYTFTDGNGNYRFGVSSGGDYTVTQIPPCGWNTLTDPQNVSVNCPGAVVQVPPFRATPNGINTGPDLTVIVIYVPDPGNPSFPCPNDTGYYSIHYYDKCGPTVAAGSTLTVTLSQWVSYGSTVNASWSQTPPVGGSPAIPSTPVITGVNSVGGGGTLSWMLGALQVGAIGEIRIPVTVSGNVATTHPFSQLWTLATINPPASVTDSDPADNIYQRLDVARCSFDPNDKTVSPTGCGPTGLINGNQPLTYMVQFQNIGSAPAFDVVVTDQLDPSLDPSTLKILGASANYVFQLNGNQMTWTFPNIFLPDAAENAPGSHGFVSYQVQPLSGLSDGTMITNQASIVFDKNPPVFTAITTNTITSATLPTASFTVAPRPGSAGHTNDFTYTGGPTGTTVFWDFGPDAIPPTSTNMNPSGVVIPAAGLRTVSLQVFSGDCTATPATYLLSVGQPVLNLASIAGNQVVLSWQGDGYALQEAGTLSGPIPWQSISPPLTQVGATHFASLGVTNTVMFYRLTDQP
jgi:uncharacterized repeat protein (TIGR01451 family)